MGHIRYLTPGERLIYTSRRHTVVLATSFVVFVVALALGLFLGAESSRWPTYHLGPIGAGITLLGTLYFGWRAGQWSLTRYVITNQRILLIEGLVARRITALPLRLVIDTTYRRTIGGRLLGYCDLELNLSGHPGLRSLTRIPNADRVYSLILRLLSGSQETAPAAEPEPKSGRETLPEPGANETVRVGVNDAAPEADRLYRLLLRLLSSHDAEPPLPEPEAEREFNDTVRMGGNETVKVTHRLPPI
ncbi:MAG: hypothetical protein QOJ93_3550 [Actinomycetota bacterium]|nr:hypothetical protein [Actinomycetota bacterium]